MLPPASSAEPVLQALGTLECSHYSAQSGLLFLSSFCMWAIAGSVEAHDFPVAARCPTWHGIAHGMVSHMTWYTMQVGVSLAADLQFLAGGDVFVGHFDSQVRALALAGLRRSIRVLP